MNKSFYSSVEYKRLQSEIAKRNWESGIFDFKIKSFQIRICKSSDCNASFEVKPGNPKLYCSTSCATHVNNQNVVRSNNGHNATQSIRRSCLNCGIITGRPTFKFCSNQCQCDYSHNEYIKKWKEGKLNGTVGVATKSTSSHIKKYLIEKYEEKCSICGWKARNPTTGQIPIEIDHIDGDSNNNAENNLRIVCPNCHSLSSTYKNLNRGRGRAWRMAKYIKNN